MEAKEQILHAMREARQPVNAGKVAEMTGLDRKIVDKAIDTFKERRRHRIARPLQVGTGEITISSLDKPPQRGALRCNDFQHIKSAR